MAPYADDIQSPDWVRSYPGGNAGDALAYTKKGFLFSQESDAAAGLPTFKIYGEYVGERVWNSRPSSGHPELERSCMPTPHRNSRQGTARQQLKYENYDPVGILGAPR